MARKFGSDVEERDVRNTGRRRKEKQDASGDPEPLEFGERDARDFGRMARFTLDTAFHPELGFSEDD